LSDSDGDPFQEGFKRKNKKDIFDVKTVGA